jgi:rhamnosyltransferase
MARQQSEPRAWRVAAIIVTYEPVMGRLTKVIKSARSQVDGVFVIDNSESPAAACALPGLCASLGARLHCNARNVGLAEAQNIGLRAARAEGFTHALLLDQDSVPGPGMVGALMRTLIEEREGVPVAAVGPRFSDARGAAPAPFARVGFPVNRPAEPAPQSATCECDFLISSGCLIPLTAIDAVGGMDDALFIDSVDLDWSFRARARGMRLLGVQRVHLEHEIGERRFRLPWGKVAIVHSPARQYYIMRNRLLLYRRRHVPLRWKAQDALRVPWRLLLFSVFVGPRRANLYHMVLGLWHGLTGRSGPLHPAGSARRSAPPTAPGG